MTTDSTNGLWDYLVDNSPVRDVRIYKVFHPRPLIYTFDRNGLTSFASVKEFDDAYGKYESNKRPEIRKCDALYLDVGQRDPARELQTSDFGPVRLDLSISSDTLFRITYHQMLTAPPDHSFETRDLRLFFEKENRSLESAKRVFESDDAKRFFERIVHSKRTSPPPRSSRN
ncbi:hypothetical protein [Bradyrhizobium sp.]|uniref:hypothetical protein n=1 Tax=Bradyrhizobium sp. TaxID=376 RepID=UPI0039E298A9